MKAYLVVPLVLLVRATAGVFHGSPSVVVDLESLTQRSNPDHDHESLHQHAQVGGSASSLVDGFTHKWMRDLASHHSLNRGNRLSLRRSLAIGDFDALNELLKGASIALPDATVSKRILFTDLVLDITNLVCTDIAVGDVVVSHNKESSQKLSLKIDILDLDMNCTLDYKYDYGFLNGEGSAEAQSNNNKATMVLGFTSTDFDVAPPTASSMDSCIAKINVDDIEFNGGFVSSILDVFQDLIGNVVEDEVEDLACNELGDMGVTFIADMLEMASEMLEPYLQDTTPEATDPLAAENAFVVTDGVELLDFQDKNSTVGQLLDAARMQIDAFLGTVVDDLEGPTADQKDLGVNVLFRKYVLDEDRAFTLNVTDLFPGGMMLYEGHDKLMDTTVELNSIKIFGLDSFTKFNPLVTIGKYTFQNELAWSFLNLELNITINIKPSTLDDSFIETPSVAEVVETVKVELGVDNLDTALSLLLAVDKAALLELKLGPLLNTNKILPCLLSSLFEMQLSEFEVQIGNIRTPSLEDFVSPGIGRVVSTAAEALFLMFEASLIDAMPNIFRVEVKDIMNGDLLRTFLDNPENLDCSPELVGGGFIDFRDLLLSPDLALSAGGTGLAPYGYIAHTLMTLLREQLLNVGEDDLPKINSLLIGPLTESQSGTRGKWQLASDLFSIDESIDDGIVSSLIKSVELRAFNTMVQNLDTLTAPLSILEPKSEPYLLTNELNIGPVQGRPLNGSMSFLIALEGDESPLNMRNELDVSLSIPSTSILADLVATIDADSFLQFPLKAISNINCLLATIPAPPLDESGNYLDPDAESSLDIKQFFVAVSEIAVDLNCVSCTTRGLEILPDLLETFDQTGIGAIVRDRIGSFTSEMVESDWIQQYIDRMLFDAPKLCPHNPSYDALAVATGFSLGFPILSRESLETMLLAGYLAAQTAVYVTAESHALMSESPPTDPLSAQAALVVPPGTPLIDFTNLGDSVGTWAADLFEEAKGIINGDSDSAFDVSKLLQDSLLDEEGLLRIKFDDFSLIEAGMRIELSEIRIRGLDSISRLDLMRAIAPQTLQNNLSIDRLTVEVVVAIGLEGTPTEKVTLSFGMSDIDLGMALMVAIDLDRLGNMELGSVLHIKQVLPCLLSTLQDIAISQMLVTVGSIDMPVIDAFMAEPLSESLLATSQMLFDKYNSTLVEATPKIFDVTIRGILNKILEAYIGEEESIICPSTAAIDSSSGFVDFRDLLLPKAISRELGGSGKEQYGDLLRTVLGLAKDKLLKVEQTDGISSFNSLLPEELSYPGDLFNQESKLDVGGLQARIELKASNARVEGLNTLGEPIDILQPVLNKPSILNNTAAIGVGSDPLRFAVTLLISLTGDDNMQLRNEVDISLDLKSASIIIGALLKISEEPFLSMPLKSITNLYCWMATIPAPPLDRRGVRVADYDPTAALTQLVVSLAQVDLNITCRSCTSPDLEDLATILSSPEAKEDATEVANKVINYATKLLGGEFLQIQIDRMLNDAAVRCPHNAAYQPDPPKAVYEPFEGSDRKENSVTFLIAMVVAAAILFAVVTIVVLAVRWIVNRRNKAWLKTLTNEHIVALYKEQKNEQEVNKATKSMFTSSTVPWYIRFSMPLIILGNIVFFLSGHLSLGATVNIEASLAGETITVEKFFDFSMAQSTIDIWNAGGKELAILILIFSGVWPYTKQIITLLLWFMPPSVVSVTRRGTVFKWLDALAKWSMVDIFALVIAIVSFRVSIESPDVAFLTEGFYSIDLMVVPMWGLYANMIAQLISQVSSHFIIHYHRRIVAVAKKDNELERQLRNGDTEMTSDNDSFRSFGSEIESGGEATNRQKEATQDEVRDQLYQHAFVRPHRGESDMLQVRHGVNACIVIMALAVIVLVIIGCSLPSFSVEVFGIIGVAVESGQGFQKAVNRYSIFDIVALLMEEARFLNSAGDYIGLGTLCILVILTVLIVPVVQVLALLWQWFRPMGRKRRGRLTNVVEILQAWQYIEVYLIAVIVSAWQLGPVSDFMINAYCDGLSGTFATMVYYGILDPADAQCFMVQASIESATYMLITGALLLALLNTFVMNAVAQYNRDTDPSLARFAEKLKRIESTSIVSSDEEDVSKMMGKIHPVPVMFTDSFRWVLRREDSVPSSHSIVVLNHGTNDVEECLSTTETGSEAGSSKKEIDVAVPPMYAFPAETFSTDDSSESASDPAANMAKVSLD